jgi:hypothetical protein
VISLKYEEYLGKDYEAITIVCPKWLNQIVPSIQEGYQIRIFDQHDDLINEINNLKLDGSALEPVSFYQDSI